MAKVHPRDLGSTKRKIKKKTIEVVLAPEPISETSIEDKFRPFFNRIPKFPIEVLYELVLHKDKYAEEIKVFIQEGKTILEEDLYFKLPGFYKQQEQERMEEKLYSLRMEVVEGVHTCAKCSCSKIQVSQAQTRSSDEGMTTFLKCTSCGNFWTSS